jgi:hypothetical protein
VGERVGGGFGRFDGLEEGGLVDDLVGGQVLIDVFFGNLV